ncbi:MAG TPA: isoprenylcysteine carboxylmethyltransferase family protein [Ferruginibacter sp.]|jgi:protein-S-isoprenylcysteine O-methyltransferase Ste14|nr:isoprenylcysteine carboxylmethyltransferase family protein [Ferruginibacter sp.]
MNSKTASIILVVIVIACGLFLAETHQILSTNPIGISIQVLSLLLMIWARVTFGIRSFHGAANTTAGELVTSGPYKWTRNPIYTSLIFFIWAGVFSYISVETIAAAIVITICLIGRALIEEKFLLTAYPEYRAYAAKTKRIIPFLI